MVAVVGGAGGAVELVELVVFGVGVGGGVVVLVVAAAVGVLVEWLVVAGRAGHCRCASAATVAAPSATLVDSEGSIPDRLLAEPVKVEAAVSTAVQFRVATAEESELIWSLSVLAWSADNRLPLLPQPASSATAKPRTPARSARGT